MNGVQPTAASWAEFTGDLRASLNAWRVAPLLPLISPALWATSALPDPWRALWLPALLFGLGWFGTERIWYLRIYRNERVEHGELLRLTGAFLGRFTRLALVAAIPWVPVFYVMFDNSVGDSARTEWAFTGPGEWLLPAAIVIVVDCALTFVTPALAFSTPRVREAFRLGIEMLGDHWPHTAWYALVPPLAAVTLGRVFPPGPSLSVAGRLAMVAGIQLLYVWFKGATVAFYLRRVEVGRDGAAFVKSLEVAAREHGDGPRAH